MIARRGLCASLLLAAAVPAQADSDCQFREPTAEEKKLVQALATATGALPKAPAGWTGDEASGGEIGFCANVDYRGTPKLLDSSARYTRVDSEELAQRNAEQIAAAAQKGQVPQDLIDRLFNTDRVAEVRVELNPATASCAGKRRPLQVTGSQAAWLCQIGWNRGGRQDDQQQGEQRFNSMVMVLFGPWKPEINLPEDVALFNAQFKPAQPYTVVQTLALTINADEARAQELLKQVDSKALGALVGR